MLTQVRLYVKGDVVGVGFRAWTKIQAKKTGACGWARNVFNKPEMFGPTGGVEVLLQGENRVVLDTIDYIKEGSPISRVDDVEVIYESPVETLQGFEILKSEAYSRH
jgi:acylphosphatase